MLSVWVLAVALASRPVHHRFDGCVVDGQMVGIRGSGLQPKRPIDLETLEGKRFTVSGDLLPGDWFFPEIETLEVAGPCDLVDSEAFRSFFGMQAYSRGHDLLVAGEVELALATLVAGIELLPHPMAHADAATALARLGRVDEALESARMAIRTSRSRLERREMRRLRRAIRRGPTT